MKRGKKWKEERKLKVKVNNKGEREEKKRKQTVEDKSSHCVDC